MNDKETEISVSLTFSGCNAIKYLKLQWILHYHNNHSNHCNPWCKGKFTFYTWDVHRGWFIQSERCKGKFTYYTLDVHRRWFIQSERCKGKFTFYTLDVQCGWFIQSERCKGCFHPHFIQSDQWTKKSQALLLMKVKGWFIHSGRQWQV